ncbi:MAG TPA: hypothetical protein VE258_05355 [Ktedonobacterales bacterium]|nr:hypothetical protein [Ktedonobacterales bacterium]
MGKNVTLRGANGRYAGSMATAERDAECARLRNRGMTYAQIGAAFGITGQSAMEAVARCYRAVRREPVEQQFAAHLERLDYLYACALKVLETMHYTVSDGRVVWLATGDDDVEAPLVDDAPVLAAVSALLKIDDQRAKLLGTYAPTKARV